MPKFQPGQSGNPGGRPKGVAAYLKKRYGDDGKKLLDALHQIAFGKVKGCTTRNRVDALTVLLDRGWGKAPQVLAGDPDAPLVSRVVFGGRYRPDGGVTGARE